MRRIIIAGTGFLAAAGLTFGALGAAAAPATVNLATYHHGAKPAVAQLDTYHHG